MSEPFLGEIRMFGFNFAPRGWSFCNGALLPIAQNSALFSLLGTIYGGDGRTTFALPDLQGRAPIFYNRGAGLSDRRIGEKGGTETETLTVQQLPPHTHGLDGTLPVSSADGTQTTPDGNILAKANDGESNYSNGASDGNMAVGGDTTSAGGGGSHNNMPPFLAVNFSIALTGIFPSRN